MEGRHEGRECGGKFCRTMSKGDGGRGTWGTRKGCLLRIHKQHMVTKGRAVSWICGEKMPFSAPGLVSLQRAFGERPNRAVGVTPSSSGPGWQNTEPKRNFLDL